ncbi:MAG TPA: long-chain-acyl-CoA synthetase [Polyangiales bacterium]
MKSTVYELACMWRVAKHVGEFAPPYMPFSMIRALDDRVAEDPNRLAVAYQDERYTFRDLDRRVNQYARFFQSRGIGQGDTVALMMDNRPDYIFALLGLNRLRAVASLINTNVIGAALTHAINVCTPRGVLVGAEHAQAVLDVAPTLQNLSGRLWYQSEAADGETPAGLESINEAVRQQSDARPVGISAPRTNDVALYIYTSGTTGLPKAAVITQKRWMSAGYLFGSAMMDASSRDIIYICLPLYHSNAMFGGVGAMLCTGAALALRRRFSASQFWDDVRKFDASVFVYIGELCRYLLNAPKNANERSHRLRLGVGNGLRGDIWEAFQRRFGVPLIREFYGATEGNAILVNFEGRPGMIGRLRVGQVAVRCDESTGEIIRNKDGFCDEVEDGQKGILLAHINPIFAFDGYLDKKASEKKIVTDVFRKGDRYFNSGDIVVRHADNWVAFADRVGDTYRWKGENVSTNEVAEVLNKAPGVLESNVYGVTVPGTEGKAGMASLNVNDTFNVEQLGRFVLDNFPVYQRPYFVRVQQDMRVTGTFKHQKVAYRDEGYDPRKVEDPLYFLDGDRYVRIDEKLYKRLAAAEIGPR